VSFELTASQALALWHGVAMERMAIRLQIYLVPPPHTVRRLAALLGVAKPVSTRALDTTGAMGCVDRVRGDKDRHNVVIKRTVAGALYIEKLGDLVLGQVRRLSP
jgi:DNA-binding MarR family transcriptional regulator